MTGPMLTNRQHISESHSPASQGKNDDMAHPPIHPTAFAPDLDGEKKKLYELIVRHFLACCSKDVIGAETGKICPEKREVHPCRA